MSKHKSRGSASLNERFRMDTFLCHVFRDLSAYADVSVPARSFLADPNTLRETVSREVATAMSNLQDGSIIEYTVLRQLEGFIKKHETWRAESRDVRNERSMAKFLYAERKCSRTNKRLAWYTRHWSRQGFAHGILNDAKKIIHNIIGDLDSNRYREILDQASFGSGQTASGTEGEHSNIFHKLTGPFSVTTKAKPILFDYFRRNGHWLDVLSFDGLMASEYAVQDWGRVVIVPKDWDIGRPIEIQPSFNIFLQKGVDVVLKDLLKHVRVYLRDQNYNREVAFRASVVGGVSTVDLRSASDTISYELVKLLLPPTWFWLLDALRTDSYSTDRGATVVKLNKFSAMGNGFTFPLESLIFYSIALACSNYCGASTSDLRVYGDDIIIDTRATLAFYEVAAYAGFEVNTSKSFVFGPFRETCGVDVVSGIDIRPVYLKKDPTCPGEVYGLYNRLLTNRVGLKYPSTLQYLYNLVRRPHVGPWTLGMGDSLRFSWESNIIYDSYFIGDPPDDGEWDADLQCYVHHVKFLSRKAKSFDVRDWQVRYLSFLLGNEGGSILCATQYSFRDKKVKVSHWPTLADVASYVTNNRRNPKVYTLGSEGGWVLRGDCREWMGALF